MIRDAIKTLLPIAGTLLAAHAQAGALLNPNSNWLLLGLGFALIFVGVWLKDSTTVMAFAEQKQARALATHFHRQ